MGRPATRVVRLTKEGRRADAVIRQTLGDLDLEWRQALGDEVHERLSRALQQLHDVLDAQPSWSSASPGPVGLLGRGKDHPSSGVLTVPDAGM